MKNVHDWFCKYWWYLAATKWMSKPCERSELWLSGPDVAGSTVRDENCIKVYQKWMPQCDFRQRNRTEVIENVMRKLNAFLKFWGNARWCVPQYQSTLNDLLLNINNLPQVSTLPCHSSRSVLKTSLNYKNSTKVIRYCNMGLVIWRGEGGTRENRRTWLAKEICKVLESLWRAIQNMY